MTERCRLPVLKGYLSNYRFANCSVHVLMCSRRGLWLLKDYFLYSDFMNHEPLVQRSSWRAEEGVVSRFKVLGGITLQYFLSKSTLSAPFLIVLYKHKKPRLTMLRSIIVYAEFSDTYFWIRDGTSQVVFMLQNYLYRNGSRRIKYTSVSVWTCILTASLFQICATTDFTWDILVK